MDGTSRIDELEQKFIVNPRRYFAPLANEYRKAGNPHQAIAICRAHLSQLPGHMSGQIVYGQALFEGGEYEQARTVFENALAMDRENLVALRHLGDLALRDGETAAARQWYSKLLEVDPKDATVVALVDEIDSAAEAQASTTDPEPSSAEPVVTVASEEEPAPVPEPEASHPDDEDKLISEELGYPVPPPHAFVTETMAELYLAQGFRDRAVNVYRQLSGLRPEDERLRARLREVEGDGAAAETQPTSEEIQPVDSAPVNSPPVDSAPAASTPVDDSPPTESVTSEPAPVEEIEQEPVTAGAEQVAAPITVREFFAGLGRRKPSSRANGSSRNGSGFDGDGSDARAAANLAGAFQMSTPPTPGSARSTPSANPGKESEEDVATFRAWLDGLTSQ